MLCVLPSDVLIIPMRLVHTLFIPRNLLLQVIYHSTNPLTKVGPAAAAAVHVSCFVDKHTHSHTHTLPHSSHSVVVK